ncbi:MAG: helix-turn-helix transcriptional regulator [Gammaproteobacteria bacterium]|jgi:ribosome-binding protein aMBF1 (putative translation factor)
MEALRASSDERPADTGYGQYPSLVFDALALRTRETDDINPYSDVRTAGAARRQFARAIRWRRRLNGWSQEALGLSAGLDRSYVGAVERVEVNISMDNADKLAAAFGVSLLELLETDVPAGFL